MMLKRFILAAVMAATAAGSALAEAVPSRLINVPKDKSAAFRLAQPAGELVVAQPDIAQIVAATDRSFYVRGKALGSTNILVYDANKKLVEVIDVRVGADADALRADFAASLPNEPIMVRNLADGFLLTGQVSTPSAALKAVNLAERYAPKAVTNSLTVRDSQQILLEVRILEASRSALQDFGIDVSAISSNVTFATGSGLLGALSPHGSLQISGSANGVSLDATLRALEEKGVIRTLAKPNLVAVSGESAEFLAGGEFPFPIPVDRDTVAIEFRPFGVKLMFKPTVQDNGFIRMKVEPEVSQLDPRQSLRINGFDVPSLTVRRATTTIDLRADQSFAIAGLFQQDYANTIRETPWLSDVPVLGTLFRSSRWKRQETELVIIVTPRLSGSENPLPLPPSPLAAGLEPKTIDLILQGLSLDRPMLDQVNEERLPDQAVVPAATPVAAPAAETTALAPV